MTPAWSDETEALFRKAVKGRLSEGVEVGASTTLLGRAEIEAILPHRDPFLLVQSVTHADLERGFLIGHYPLDQASNIFAGHFPQHPMYPGVLQVEAIGQAGILLWHLQDRARKMLPKRMFLTHVLGARFLGVVGDSGHQLELAVTTVEDGLFATIVGQCVWNGSVCSAAAVSIITDEDKGGIREAQQ